MTMAPTASPNTTVFDGYCHVCSGWVQFHLRHPADPPFELIPMQSDAGRALASRDGVDPDDPTTFLLLDRGKCLTESDAAYKFVDQ